MRYLIVATIVSLALASGGCEKPQPQAAPRQEPVEVRPMASLAPAEPGPAAAPKSELAPEPPAAEPVALTPRATPPVAPQPAPLPPPREYTVQRKDTLWSIAVRYLGDGKRWKEIQALNGNLDPAKLKPGQTIMLPPK